MTKTGMLIFIFVFSFFGLCSINAQNNQEKQILAQILNEIEERFQCDFSYADDDIVGFILTPPSPSLTLDETIAYLKENTGLVFNALENKLFTITTSDVISFCGTVKDYETDMPVKNVSVQSGSQSAISDENGYFKISNISSRDTITIRHLSYKTIKTNANSTSDDPCSTIYLFPKIQKLEEVIITDYITRGINKTSQGSFKINYNDFGILPGLIEKDPLQTLQALPGIQSFDETVTNINIRGGTHDQNLITWNGIKMYQSGHFFSLISAFNPYLSKNVTLTKNGTPAALTGGVSGTIEVFSKEDISTEFNAAMGLNLISMDGFLEMPIGKKASVEISGRRSYNDFVRTHTYDHYFNKAFQNTEVVSNQDNVISTDDDFVFYDISAVLLYEVSEKDKLKVSFMNMHNRLSFLESAFINNVEESRESRTQQNNVTGGILYNRTWNKTFKTSLHFYGIDYTIKARNVDILEDRQLIQENKVMESGVKLTSEIALNERMLFSGGYNFIRTGISNLEETDTPFFRNFSKNRVEEHGLFSEIDYRFANQRSRLKAGLRLNYIAPLNRFIPEPRISFSHRFWDYFIWDVLGEFKNQTTTQTIDFQTDFLGVENRRWILSDNDAIPIIKSKQLSAGLTFKNNGWLCNIETYFKSVNGIVSQSQGFRNQYEFSKTRGSYRVGGMDFIINKKVKQFSTWFSYSYANNKYEFAPLQVALFRSNLDVRHHITFGTSYGLKNFKFSVGMNWHSGKPTTRPIPGNEVINNSINYEPANMRNLPYYLRFDSSITYDFKIAGKIKVHSGISLWNATNRNNKLSNYYQFTDINFPSEVVQNSLELTPNAVLRVLF